MRSIQGSVVHDRCEFGWGGLGWNWTAGRIFSLEFFAVTLPLVLQHLLYRAALGVLIDTFWLAYNHLLHSIPLKPRNNFIFIRQKYRKSAELRTVPLTKHAHAANWKSNYFFSPLPIRRSPRNTQTDIVHMPLVARKSYISYEHKDLAITLERQCSTKRQIDSQAIKGCSHLRSFLDIHADLFTHGLQDGDVWKSRLDSS